MEIGSLVSKVIKVDLQTDKGTRGQFARFAVQVNLSKPLASKIRVANRLHRVEYESLPLIYFQCGRFGHLSDGCPHGNKERSTENNGDNSPNVNIADNSPNVNIAKQRTNMTEV